LAELKIQIEFEELIKRSRDNTRLYNTITLYERLERIDNFYLNLRRKTRHKAKKNYILRSRSI